MLDIASLFGVNASVSSFDDTSDNFFFLKEKQLHDQTLIIPTTGVFIDYYNSSHPDLLRAIITAQGVLVLSTVHLFAKRCQLLSRSESE